MTPEQMRALADITDSLNRDNEWDNDLIADVMMALRTAADQLDALERWRDRVRWNSSDVADEADAYLTADTAPQEPTEPKRILMTHPHDGHSPEDTCRDCEASDG